MAPSERSPPAGSALRRPPTSAASGLPTSTADPRAIQAQPAPGSCQARGSGRFSLPDPRCTPGATDPAVDQQNLDETVCRVGYTKTIRPPEAITEPEKEASIAAYGDHDPLHDYEYDHLVPLELGGAGNDPRNLWPEKRGSFGAARVKDRLENFLHRAVCSGRMSLRAAQLGIAGDWYAMWVRLGRP